MTLARKVLGWNWEAEEDGTNKLGRRDTYGACCGKKEKLLKLQC